MSKKNHSSEKLTRYTILTAEQEQEFSTVCEEVTHGLCDFPTCSHDICKCKVNAAHLERQAAKQSA